jgi:hypothetical protein
MDRYAQAAKGGEHHPQETYPTQGKLFGGAAGASLVGEGTGTGILAAPSDANAGDRSTTTSPGILDSALSMLAGGMSPDTAEGQIAEQRDQIYDFIVGKGAQAIGAAGDAAQMYGAGLEQHAAMSDPRISAERVRSAGSVFGDANVPRNQFWNMDNMPGTTNWFMRQAGANPESGGAFMGMLSGGTGLAAGVKAAGGALSKFVNKTGKSKTIFRKPIEPLDGWSVTDEQVPGAPGHMEGMKYQPDDVRNYYSMEGRAREHRGRNPFYADQQQFGTVRAQGDYTNESGMREHNTVWSTGMDSRTPAELVTPRQHLRALVDAQAASAAHRVDPDVPLDQIDSARIDAGPQHGPDVMDTVRKNLEARGLATLDTGNGVTTVRGPFDDSMSPAGVRGILSELPNGDIGVPRAVLHEGKFESVFEMPAWNKQEGTGQAIDNWLTTTKDSDYTGIDTQVLRDYVLGKRQIDDLYSKALKLPQREDLRKMRAMIANMGIQGFRDYVRKHGSQGLPVALIGTTAALSQRTQPQPALMENGS